MIKKTAQKCLVLLLIFLILFFSTISPIAKNFAFAQIMQEGTDLLNTATLQDVRTSYSPPVYTPPPEDVDTSVGDQSYSVRENLCPDCFGTAPRGYTVWQMLRGAADTLLSIIPRLLVLVLKWLVMLSSSLLMSLMAPKPDGYFLKTGLIRSSVQNPFVPHLWNVAKSYANLMIVLFLIWIAINIILGIKEFVNYQYLVKLLVVALLINFSLVICGLLVDISNYLTVLFMSRVDGSGFSCLYTCVIDRIANMFVTSASGMLFSQTLANTVAAIIGLIFLGQIVGLIMYVCVRYVILWFLVGVSPIAIVLSTIPQTEKIFKEWRNHFVTNLVNLPVLAFASFFILNFMLVIANNLINYPFEPGEKLAGSLGIVILLIILAQGLLIVAQNLNVTQISSATSKINSWAKKTVKTATTSGRKYVADKGMRAFAGNKGVSKYLDKWSHSKNATVSKFAYEAKQKFQDIQKKTAVDLEHLYKNRNWEALEKQADSKDIVVATQAMEYLAKLDKTGDYRKTKGIKYTEDNEKIERIRKVADENDIIGESAAFKSLKSILPQFKFGAAKLQTPEDINKAIREITGILNDPEKSKQINLRSTLDLLVANSGENLPLLMEKLSQAISPEIMHRLSKNLGSTGWTSFMDSVAKAINVAYDAKAKNWDEKEVAKNIKLLTEKLNDKNLAPQIRDALIKKLPEKSYEIAKRKDHWFSKSYQGKRNLFAATAIGRGYIDHFCPDYDSSAGSNPPGAGTPPPKGPGKGSPPPPGSGAGTPPPNSSAGPEYAEGFTQTDSGVWVPPTGFSSKKSSDTDSSPKNTSSKESSAKPGQSVPNANIDLFTKELSNVYEKLSGQIQEVKSQVSSSDFKEVLEKVQEYQSRVSSVDSRLYEVESYQNALREYSAEIRDLKDRISRWELDSADEKQRLEQTLKELSSAMDSLASKTKEENYNPYDPQSL